MTSDLLRRRLEVLLKLPENTFCADCGARGPRWGSVKLGIFICPQCAGIHRKLGTHISFVQSVSIDKWKPEWVELAERVGNRVSNDYYESNVPAHLVRPTPSQCSGGDTIDSVTASRLEKWLRNKYELKLFINPEMNNPVTTTSPKKSVSPKKNQKIVQIVGDIPLGVSPNPIPAPIVAPPFEWTQNVFLASFYAK